MASKTGTHASGGPYGSQQQTLPRVPYILGSIIYRLDVLCFMLLFFLVRWRRPCSGPLTSSVSCGSGLRWDAVSNQMTTPIDSASYTQSVPRLYYYMWCIENSSRTPEAFSVGNCQVQEFACGAVADARRWYNAVETDQSVDLLVSVDGKKLPVRRWESKSRVLRDCTTVVYTVHTLLNVFQPSTTNRWRRIFFTAVAFEPPLISCYQ